MKSKQPHVLCPACLVCVCACVFVVFKTPVVEAIGALLSLQVD